MGTVTQIKDLDSSSWSNNILIRILLYLADTIQEYLHSRGKDVHDRKQIALPEPEFYVIYTGTQPVPAEISLRKDFFGNPDGMIDLTARVYTAETSDIIGQYIVFCRVLDDQIQRHEKTAEAAREAIRICQDRGVLTGYLKDREKEVVSIVIMLFDQEYAVKQFGIAQREEGRIIESVEIYRKEMDLDDQSILNRIMEKFKLDRHEAEQYVMAETPEKVYQAE